MKSVDIVYSINISKKDLLAIFREILRGRSLTRIICNLELRNVNLAGKILDIGSKDSKASYYRFLKIRNGSTIIFTDLNPQGDNVIFLNAEERFPFKDQEFDNILAMWVMEHLYNFKNLLNESFRILKDEGLLVISVPFIHEYHADPDDYFRYTHRALIRLGKEAGFKEIKIYVISLGIVTTLGEKFVSLLIPSTSLKKYIRLISFSLTYCIDKILLATLGNKYENKIIYFPLGFLVLYKKKEF